MDTYFGVTAKIADLDKEDALVLQSELLDFCWIAGWNSR